MSRWVPIVITLLSAISASSEYTSYNESGEYYVVSDAASDFNSITCQYNTHCRVICDEDSGCDSLKIDASSANFLTIECPNAYSCKNLKLLEAPSNSVWIKCSGDNACAAAEFRANDTRNVYVDCINSNVDAYTTNSAVNPCYDTALYVTDAKSVNISCHGDDTCYMINVYANKADSVSIFVDGSYALYESNIHAHHSNKMHLFCGYEHTSCYQNKLYFPTSFSLSCYGRACEQFGDLYLLAAITSVDIDYNGCGECYSAANCAPESTKVYCKNPYGPYAGDYYAYLSYGSCESYHCGCAILENAMKDNYYVDRSVCPTNSWSGASSGAAFVGVVWSIIFWIIICICCCGCCGVGLYYVCFKPKRHRGPRGGVVLMGNGVAAPYVPIQQIQQQGVHPKVVVMDPQNVPMQEAAPPYAPPTSAVPTQQAAPPYVAPVQQTAALYTVAQPVMSGALAPSAPVQEGAAGNVYATNQ